LFAANPAGVQADGLWTEGHAADWSFDTVWQSRAQLTPQGYVVWIAIPFRSLRFHPAAGATWGITLTRYAAAKDEEAWWPHVSAKISGRLNQEATLGGLENISPGRSMQFIPYGAFRSFRGLDTRDPAQPRFRSRLADMKAGLDSKFVFRDSLVVDATVNPDFAQVESDEPQNTVNQRFEVFFPEKRPFFMENANFFEGPLIAVTLQSRFLFTRRIADPEFGARLTGKQGPWNLGFLVADDRSPGKLVPESDPLHGQRAYFAVGRISRDVGEQHSIGVLFTDREFQNDFNRVGGVDGLLRLSKNWRTSYRGMLSSTRTGADIPRISFPAITARMVGAALPLISTSRAWGTVISKSSPRCAAYSRTVRSTAAPISPAGTVDAPDDGGSERARETRIQNPGVRREKGFLPDSWIAPVWYGCRIKASLARSKVASNREARPRSAPDPHPISLRSLYKRMR
jgi:hypothetical protein